MGEVTHEVTVVLRFFRSTMPRKKKLHHYWTTFRIGPVEKLDGYKFLGTGVRDGVRVYLHSNLPKWLETKAITTKAMKDAYFYVKYPRKEGWTGNGR